MKISIVVPVLNDVRIARALDSILEQQLGHTIEIIVIDACSNDRTPDVLKRYADNLDVLIREADKSPYHGMNKGIQQATGGVIGILNADDRYSDRRVLADVIDVFQRNAAVDVCWGNMSYVNARSDIVRYWRAGNNSQYRWYFGWRPPHPGFFVRKSVYQRYGGFNISLDIAADYELQLRLLLRNKLRSVYMNRTLVYMEEGGVSNKSAYHVIKANWESYQAWRINKLRGGQMVPFIKPLRSALQLIPYYRWAENFR